MVIKKLIEVITHIGEFFILMKDSVLGVTNLYKIRKELLRQLEFFGVNSIPLVSFASLFTGMVSSVQTAYQIRDYAPLDFLGAGVAKAVMVELGPVLTALIMAGRVGAGIAAELGTMRVTEQIDALEVIGIDPAGFLILPRLIAGLIMVPLLTVLADFVAITGSAVISKLILDLDFSVFFQGIKLFFHSIELFGGLLKSVVFGFIIAAVGSYSGYIAKEGAVGVGKATTRAVVISSLTVLMADYFLGVILYG